MKQVLSLLLFSSFLSNGFAQLQIKPEQPTAKDTIAFNYNSEKAFSPGSKVSCIIYFTGLNDRSKERDDFPLAMEIPLTASGNSWSGKITFIPDRSTSILFAFVDNLNHRDTNNGSGYYTPLYSNGQPLPGAWAGIGSLIYGNWITNESPFHIKYDMNALKDLFMKDFSAYPDVKREYFREYLDILKINTPDEERLYKKELEELAALPQLTHRELLTLFFQYGRLKDTVNANKYNRQVIEKYPSSSWSLETKSMKLLITAMRENDFRKQADAYETFKTTYLKTFPEEHATLSMNLRAGQMLGYMVDHFADEGTIDLWIKEVDVLSNEGKEWAYKFGARSLLGLQERPTKPVSKNQSVEHAFLVNNLEDPATKVKLAGDLAMRGVKVYENALNEPRKINEPLNMIEAQVMDHRNELMSGGLEILGITLMRQNRFSEAVDVMTDAVNKNHYKESSINQTYIESLVRAGEIDKALSEIEKIVSMGKSTNVIDSFYAKYKKKGDDINAFKDQSIELVKQSLKEKILNEDLPDFIFYDLSGKEIKSSSLKNKVVVIDFWASWCPPCMIALEGNDQVIDKYKADSEVVFLLLGEDESKEKAIRIVDRHKNKGSFVFDKNHELVKKLAASLPTQLIVDKKGKIKFRTNGLTSYNVQENMVELQAMIEMVKGTNQK